VDRQPSQAVNAMKKLFHHLPSFFAFFILFLAFCLPLRAMGLDQWIAWLFAGPLAMWVDYLLRHFVSWWPNSTLKSDNDDPKPN
jgi:hypothetical protein